MELQVTLLKNEVEHLTKNMAILSEEIIILREFLGREFAHKFEAFSSARKLKCQLSQAASSTQIVEATEIKQEPIIATGIMDEEEEMVFEVEANDEEEESDDEDNQFQINPIIDQQSSKTHFNGKPKSKIHDYFEHIPTSNGKVKTKCYNCSEMVSNQAQRLKKHFEKCLKLSQSNSAVVKSLVAISKHRKSSPTEEENVKGRKRDAVRQLFEPSKDSGGFLKMKCLQCGHLVSNQPTRMRNHIEKCKTQNNNLDSGQSQGEIGSVFDITNNLNSTLTDPLAN